MEKFLDLPIVSNAIGRWIKVSNRGVANDMQRKVTERVQREQARSRLNSKDAINELIETQQLGPRSRQNLGTDPRAAKYFLNNAADRAAGSVMRPEIRKVLNASSREERAALETFLIEEERKRKNQMFKLP